MAAGRWLVQRGGWFLLAILVCGLFVWNYGWRRKDTGSSLLDRGREAYRLEQWADAESLARERLRLAPDDREAVRLLARSMGRLGQDAPANALFARLGEADLQPEDLYLLGLGLDRAGQGESALRLWQKALAADPDHAEILEHVSLAYAARNRLVEAAQLTERLARIPGWELRGGVNQGGLLYELNDPAQASEVFQEALSRPDAPSLDPSILARSRKLLARALLRTGKVVKARAVIQELIAANGDREAFWLLSRACLQGGLNEQAVEALKKAEGYRADHPLDLEPAPYLGENRCTECHREIARAYHASRSTTTLVRGDDLLKLPYPDKPYPDPEIPSVIHRYTKQDGKVHVETDVEGKLVQTVVDYAFGSPDRYSSLVGHDKEGKSYILRLSYFNNGPAGSGWVRTTGHTADAQGGKDFPGKVLDPADGVLRCLFCHTTNALSVLHGVGVESNDRSIGCERCHGPGGNHVKAVEAKLSDMAIVSPAQGSGEGSIRLCAQCHALHTEMDIPRTDTFWSRFQGTNLLWSRCFTESAGALDCMTCHDPHRNAEHSKAYYEAKCLSCHAREGQEGKKAGNKACPVNPSTGCIGCHMPPFYSKPLHTTFADHYIRVHPELKTGQGGVGKR